MTQEFRLADIGEGLEEAEIIEWKVAVGDTVTRDQPLVEVMTDKSNAELPAPCDGVVLSVGGDVGDIIEVGAILAIIDDAAHIDDVVNSDDAAPSAASPADTRNLVDAAPADTASDDAGVSTFQRAAAVPDAPSPTQPTTSSAAPGGRVKASPTTRSEAARRGIDLALIVGTGPGGRILLGDLDQADGAEAPPVAPGIASASALDASSLDTPYVDPSYVAPIVEDEPPASPAMTVVEPSAPPVPLVATEPQADTDPEPAQAVPAVDTTVVPLRGIRRAIAQNMNRSWSDIPHIHAFAHIDAEPMLELRSQLRSSGRAEFASLTPLSFFVAAVTAAMAAHPQANASLSLERGEITTYPRVNVGVAVAAPNGLVVPVIRDADGRAFSDIAAAVRSRVDQARAGELTAEDFRDGTVTITNFGSLGGEQALPLIRPPESAIFGFGSIAPRPFVIDDQVVARKTMHLVIGADHRLLDGDVTTALLNQVAELLSNPINLVLGD